MPRRRRVKREGEATVWVARVSSSPYLAIRWLDPDSGRTCQRSTGCTRRRDAEREAAKLAEKLEAGIIDQEFGWDQFRERYEREKLAGHPCGTRKNWESVANRYEDTVNPQSIHQAADPRRISRYIGCLRADGLRETTITGHVRYLHAAFQWAADMLLIKMVPHWPKLVRQQKWRFMRGRPLTPAEFRRMLRAAKVERPGNWRAWVRLLRGLWLSGLRIGEAIILSWDGGGFAVDLTGKHPAFRIQADSQKSGRDELLPMTPDFARWLLRTSEVGRTGLVFPLAGQAGQMTIKRVSRTISAIGRRAGVAVSADPPKHASAHDLRRSFGTRWAKRVMPAVLRRLMRHASIETTMRYYVDIEADELAADLWGQEKVRATAAGPVVNAN